MNYILEIIFCVDGTNSMGNLIEYIKSNAIRFEQHLVNKLKQNGVQFKNIYSKVIVFRDYHFDEERAMEESIFYDLNDNRTQFVNYINSIKTGGGADDPENGLEALALAMQSNWNWNETNSIRLILLWTDNAAHDFSFNLSKNLPLYPKNLPKTFQELSMLWKEKFYLSSSISRLVIFAPNFFPWYQINNQWENVLHYLKTDQELDSVTQNITKSVVDEIFKTAQKKKSIEHNSENQRIHKLENEIERLKQEISRLLDYQLSATSNPTVSYDEYFEELRETSELYIWNELKKLYPNRVKWLNMDGESWNDHDFEILNPDISIKLYIDCKGTTSNKQTFYMTINEWNCFLKNSSNFQIYRVFNTTTESSRYYIKIDNLLSWIMAGKAVPCLNATETIKGGRIFITLK
jgi:Protein NO VEIN, C-terminal